MHYEAAVGSKEHGRHYGRKGLLINRCRGVDAMMSGNAKTDVQLKRQAYVSSSLNRAVEYLRNNVKRNIRIDLSISKQIETC